MEYNMKCEKCGGEMKKVDEHTMKCDKCGMVVKTGERNANGTQVI